MIQRDPYILENPHLILYYRQPSSREIDRVEDARQEFYSFLRGYRQGRMPHDIATSLRACIQRIPNIEFFSSLRNSLLEQLSEFFED